MVPKFYLESLDDASEEPQDGVQPMIKGLDKATRPNSRRVTSCPEVCSQLVHKPMRLSNHIGVLNRVRHFECFTKTSFQLTRSQCWRD